MEIPRFLGFKALAVILTVQLSPAVLCPSVFAQSSVSATTDALGHGGGIYRIGVGDRLNIAIVGRPQLTRESLAVDGRGEIRLPFIKEPIIAACATEVELADTIAQRYAEYLIEPQVSVSVASYGSRPVQVLGAVTKPGLFQMQREVRLRELLAIAGGLAPTAGRFAEFVRDDDAPRCDAPTQTGDVVAAQASTTVMSIDLRRLLRGETADPVVRPGDFVHVPEADQAFVVGNVVRPSTIPLVERISITRAIAMAGGRQTASKDQVRLIRRNVENGPSIEILVDLKAIEQHAALDIELQPGDIVEVPVSQGKQVLRAAVSALISAGMYYPLLLIR
jgi:polysaccharide export outer membrane protein